MTKPPLHILAGYLAIIATGLVLGLGAAGRLAAADTPRELTWGQLIPPMAAPARQNKFFGQGAIPKGDLQQPDHAGGEGRWLGSAKKPMSEPAPVVADLDGKLVHIGGYVVPLDFDSTNVKEFLLVPYVGACIHVPPPTANQIIYVKAAKGFDVKGTFEPVFVTGRLKTAAASTGLAETGYSMDAERVDRK